MSPGFIAKELLPALLMLTAANASADSIFCSDLSGSTLATIESTGSCSFGDLAFSSFAYRFTPSADSSAVSKPSTDVNEMTDGMTSSPFGAVDTAASPLYLLLVNFTAGNTMAENERERYIPQYPVTINNSEASTLCDGAPFAPNSGTSTGACSGAPYTSAAPDGGSQVTGNPDSQADSSILYNVPDQKFGGTTGGSNAGVYGQADIRGGTTSALGSANLKQVQADFLGSPASNIPIPEPAGFLACALAFGCLLVKPLRRRIAVK